MCMLGRTEWRVFFCFHSIIIMDTCDLKRCEDFPPAVILWWMLADVLKFSPDITEDSVRIHRMTVQSPRLLHPHNHTQTGPSEFPPN